jgi:hypothetical protein
MKARQLVASDALLVGGPVTPAVGWLEGGPELLAGECHLLFPLDLKVIQEFQEHDPGQQRQTVEGPLHHVATTQTCPSNLRVRSSNLFGRANDFNHLRAAHRSKTKIRTVFRGRLEKCPPLLPQPKWTRQNLLISISDQRGTQNKTSYQKGHSGERAAAKACRLVTGRHSSNPRKSGLVAGRGR